MAKIQESGRRDIRNIARIDETCRLTTRGYYEFTSIANAFEIERRLSEILHKPVRSKDRPSNRTGFNNSLDFSFVRRLVLIACVDLRQEHNSFDTSCQPQEFCDSSGR